MIISERQAELKRFNPKDNLPKSKYIIQCKRYSLDNRVGVQAIRELYGVAASNKANKAILISTSSFTKSCIEFAQENSIELIDGEKLVEMLKEYSIKIHQGSDEPDITDVIISQLNAIIQESEKQTLSDDELAEHLRELLHPFTEESELLSQIFRTKIEEGSIHIDASAIEKV